MPKKSLIGLFFLVIFSTVFFSGTSPVFAKPEIDDIFVYQPEDNLSTVQVVIFGKDLPGDLIFSLQECLYPKNQKYPDHVILSCALPEDFPSRDLKASLLLKDGTKIQDIDFSYSSKKEFSKRYGKQTVIYYASGALEYWGNGELYVLGNQLPSTLTLDVDCEDALVQKSWTPDKIVFSCHKTVKERSFSEFFSFLVKDSKTGKAWYHASHYLNDSFYIPTVHVNPFSTNGKDFFVIHVFGLASPEFWENDLEIKADFCSQTWYVPDLFTKQATGYGPGQDFLCKRNPNSTGDSLAVNVVHKSTNTLLWPIDVETQGNVLFRTDNTPMKARSLRSLYFPNVPSVSQELQQEKLILTVENTSDVLPDFLLESSFCLTTERKITPPSDPERYWKASKSYSTLFSCPFNPQLKSEKDWFRIVDQKNKEVVYQDMPFNNTETIAQFFYFRPPRKGNWFEVNGKNLGSQIRIFSSYCDQVEFLGSRYYLDFDCIPDNPRPFIATDIVVFDEVQKQVYWPIDIKNGSAEPLQDFLQRKGLGAVYTKRISEPSQKKTKKTVKKTRLKKSLKRKSNT